MKGVRVSPLEPRDKDAGRRPVEKPTGCKHVKWQKCGFLN